MGRYTMSNDTLTKLELTQAGLPHWYKKYSGDKSIMYALLDAFSKATGDTGDIAKRLDDAIGIDTTNDKDLEYRWGSLLGVSKANNESYDLYRSKLKLAIPSLIGGTKDAIVHAIAIIIGIEKDHGLQADYIDVVDGWEYNGESEIPDEYRQYGCFVCTIDMNVGEGAIDVEQKVIDAINRIKASGTSFYVLYKGIRLLKYYNMDAFKYDTLDGTVYDNFGKK